MSEHLQSNILLLSLQYFQTFILLNYQIDVSTMLFLPPWLNPQTNMFSGWMPSATSLSIMACTFSTALRTPVSSCGEPYSFKIAATSKFQCLGLFDCWCYGVNSQRSWEARGYRTTTVWQNHLPGGKDSLSANVDLKQLYIQGLKKSIWWRKLTVAWYGGAGSGGERPLGEPELRGGEEVADGLVGRAWVAEAVQPQHETPVASCHVGGGDELGGKPGRRRAAAEWGDEERGRADGLGEGEEQADHIELAIRHLQKASNLLLLARQPIT